MSDGRARAGGHGSLAGMSSVRRSEEHTSELQSPRSPLFPYTTLSDLRVLADVAQPAGPSPRCRTVGPGLVGTVAWPGCRAYGAGRSRVGESEGFRDLAVSSTD